MFHKMLFPGYRSKCFTMSYDDDVFQLRRFTEILDRYGIRCTLNLNSGMLETTPRTITRAEVKEFYDRGYEIAAHGRSHLCGGIVTDKMEAYEIASDIAALEALTGGIVRGMAYPDDSRTASTVEVLRRCGIVYARTVHPTHTWLLPENWLLLHPTCHHDDPELFSLLDAFLADKGDHRPRMFYVWGHSYEFDHHDNWDRLEELCKKIGGRNEIWYATNLEIYDYVKAYESLIFSSDGTVVHNPTATSVCLGVGTYYKSLVTVLPGETMILQGEKTC